MFNEFLSGQCELPLDLPVAKSCKTCKFYLMHEYENVAEDSDYGMCRRFPPTRVNSRDSSFPIVIDDNWCGEWKV